MGLSEKQIREVERILKSSLRSKFQDYNPEPASMPFHTRLLGKDRMALFSFIHSLNTNFGTAIFEPVALSLASASFSSAQSQQSAGNQISSEAHGVIQNIMDNLATPYNPYEPQAYNRWTMRGMLDLENELKVAEEFWDFLGGHGAYQQLLNIFERAGIELRPEIDEYFSRYNRR